MVNCILRLLTLAMLAAIGVCCILLARRNGNGGCDFAIGCWVPVVGRRFGYKQGVVSTVFDQ